MITFNLAARFVLELCALSALAYWGFVTGQSPLAKALLGLGAPLLAAIAWGSFVAPKARWPAPEPWRLLVEVLVFGAAAAGLYAAGQPLLAFALLAAYAANRFLLMRRGSLG
jgi:hypothetical protein